ncbi:hypothetical protein DRE_00138 [Drechslerella stenobrocha 248]|uniref:Ig-like domain-containing protein n=1 Tax=Drechslerella stenobrocha 248 TaxID=1043628 RepID=W7I940_9PEZI|nr:hypothetical protein DRE_00138 [Drechslerella stenobrocha 248]
MKFATLALIAASAVAAQVTDGPNGEFLCLGASAGKNFCVGESLSSNIIIRCTGEKGQPGNCNNNLAGVPPIGVKTGARCWQTSETSGDAACSFDGIVYSDTGASFPVPSKSSSSTATSASSVSSASYHSAPPPPPSYTPLSSTRSTAVYTPLTPSYGNTTTTASSTHTTVTGTVTVTTCSTCTGTAHPPAPPKSNVTTTGLPVPTRSPNGAGVLFARDSLFVGVVALIGFLFL